MSRATLSSHYGVRMLGCLLDLYVSKLRWTPENNNEEVFLLSSIIFFSRSVYSNTVFFELFQNGNVSSGEESVVNGVNTDNDETSKDSEGKVMLCF